MDQRYSGVIATQLGLKEQHVAAVLKLFGEGSTVPFIARYRKEMTGSMDEVAIIAVRDHGERMAELDRRRAVVIKSIGEQDKMTDSLLDSLNACVTLAELEDLYLPYRPKRKTRAEMARERGLLPLAKTVYAQGLVPLEREALAYVNTEKGVASVEDALAGARDIIAEWINENKVCRARARQLFAREALVRSRVVKGKEQEAEKYLDYFQWEELLRKVPSHRYLAMMRGEEEGMLKVEVRPSEEEALQLLERVVVKSDFDTGAQVVMAVKDCWKRLMAPSLETEARSQAKEQADAKAIEVFVSNVRQLLMAPPLGEKRVLAIDPGFRTGCKVVCLDQYGQLLHNTTIYPHPPQNETGQAVKKLQSLITQYKIEAIAIGNGTAGRETEALVRKITFDRNVVAVVVNESGASVYSASKVARDEFPDYDITVRGSVSIGRRLQDPLAELVKIDPKSIGVGQYQHDVDQKALARALDDTVVSCVNHVGVDLNNASKQLLANVSGIGEGLAANIVAYRSENGPFTSRRQLSDVPRLGPKAFEQAAGFLRIRNAEDLLDNTGVHPEAYPLVQKMAASLKLSLKELLNDPEARKTLRPEQFAGTKFGIPTIADILQELEKPGRDPRAQFELVDFDANIKNIGDLHPGMVLNGIVTNITAFGAFVDIGVHQDGLVHISQVADEFITDINKHLHLHQKIKVKVLQIEPERKRIQLSMKGLS